MQELHLSIPWTFILSVAAVLIGFIGTSLQFAEKKTMGLICSGLVVVINVLSAGMDKYHQDKALADDKDYKTFVRGTSEVPALTAYNQPMIDSTGKQVSRIVFLLSNTDKVYPLREVKVKFMEGQSKNIGTLYANAHTEIYQIDPSITDTFNCYIAVWYNTGKVEVDFIVTKDAGGNIHVSSKYLDSSQKEFEPNWQKRAKEYNLKKDTTIQHYNPMLYQPTQ